jgi:deoxycytidine triphosphate deaminase
MQDSQDSSLPNAPAVHPWKYQDPAQDSPGSKGLLLSNEIEKFCKNKLLITPYSETHLRPAAYTLTIGPDYVDSSGRIRKLDEKESFFYMEPNSIVYVSTAEQLDLPFYIVARFNLRVKWVYKGILLGTGPQVEPGFRGNLSCPLFNLTSKPIKIKLGEEFATIDFERTSDFCVGKKPEEIQAQCRALEHDDEVKFGDERFLMFKQKSFAPLQHLPDHDVVSSLVQMSDEVKTWRAIGVGTVVAFIGLALTLLNFQNNLYRELRATSQQLSTMQEDLNQQKHQLATMNGMLKNATPTVPSSGQGTSHAAQTKRTKP